MGQITNIQKIILLPQSVNCTEDSRDSCCLWKLVKKIFEFIKNCFCCFSEKKLRHDVKPIKEESAASKVTKKTFEQEAAFNEEKHQFELKQLKWKQNEELRRIDAVHKKEKAINAKHAQQVDKEIEQIDQNIIANKAKLERDKEDHRKKMAVKREQFEKEFGQPAQEHPPSKPQPKLNNQKINSLPLPQNTAKTTTQELKDPKLKAFKENIARRKESQEHMENEITLVNKRYAEKMKKDESNWYIELDKLSIEDPNFDNDLTSLNNNQEIKRKELENTRDLEIKTIQEKYKK